LLRPTAAANNGPVQRILPSFPPGPLPTCRRSCHAFAAPWSYDARSLGLAFLTPGRRGRARAALYQEARRQRPAHFDREVRAVRLRHRLRPGTPDGGQGAQAVLHRLLATGHYGAGGRPDAAAP